MVTYITEEIMEGDNFVMPGARRVPSVFAASCLFFFAVVGKLGISTLMGLIQRLMANFNVNSEAGAYYAAVIIYYCLFVLLPLLIYSRITPGLGGYTRIKPAGAISLIMCALAGAAGYFFCAYLDYFWLMGIEAIGGNIVSSSLYRLEGTSGALVMFMCIALIPAVCEELLCRGCMLSAWEEKGSKKAMLITAVYFMLIHSNVSGMPVELVSGLILAYVVISCDSLFAGMVYHTAHNSMALIMQNLAANRQSAEASTIYEAIGGTPFAIISLLIVLSVVGAVLAGWLILIRVINRKKPFGKPPLEAEPKSAWEVIVIICGIIAALALYTSDVLGVLGYGV